MDSCQSNPACPGRQLSYKTSQHGGELIVADRWYPSTQIHHGCRAPDGPPCRLVGKHRIDKHLLCPQTGEIVEPRRQRQLRPSRSHNAIGSPANPIG